MNKLARILIEEGLRLAAMSEDSAEYWFSEGYDDGRKGRKQYAEVPARWAKDYQKGWNQGVLKADTDRSYR